MPPKKKPTTKRQILKPINTKPLCGALVGLIILVLLADMIYHARSETKEISQMAFYAWFSVVSCIGLFAAAQALHKLIKRNGKYYRREAESS